MKKNIAVIGAGYWGKNLARNMYQLGALNTICDSNELLSESYKQAYPDAKFTTNYKDVLKNSDIEGVAIATPAVTHYDFALSALEAGKHVFVEKPLSLYVEQGEKLVVEAEKRNLTLMVGHILQYHSAVLKLKELIDDGELGRVQYLCSNRLSIGKIRTEENILWSFAPHDISVILMLLGEEPNKVSATGGKYLQSNVDDVTLTTMEFPSGVKAHIFVSWLHPFKEQKLVVIGDKKMAVFDDVSQDKLLLYPHQINWHRRTPVANKADAVVVPIEKTEPLKEECSHFLECIEGNINAKTDGKEGIRVLKVLQKSQNALDQANELIQTDHLKEKSETYPVRDSDTPVFIHESSYVDNNVHIGEGTKIWHFSHILSNTVVGKGCNIGQNVVIGPDVKTGDRCKIQNNVSIYKGVTLEDEVFCGPSMVFTNIHNPRAGISRMHEVRETLVKKGATIGANATIVCGNTIGAYAFIGAGSVVTTEVPDYALMMGNPAKQCGWICTCGQKLKPYGQELTCTECGSIYLQTDNTIKIRD